MHNFTILPLGSPALTSFYSITIYLVTLTTFYPRWQPSSNLILPPLSNWPTHTHNNLPLPLGSPALTSFYSLWTIYPLTLTTFYPPWQPSSNLIFLPLNNLPTHTYKFYPRWQPSSNLILLPLNNLPTHTYKFYPLPLGSPALTSFYSLWTIYPLTLTTFYPRWQPSSNLILLPLNNLPTHTYNILPLLADPALTSFYSLWTITHSHSQQFTPCPPWQPSSNLIFSLWTFYPLTLTAFYPCWQPSSNLIFLPLNNLPTHTLQILQSSHLAAQL